MSGKVNFIEVELEEACTYCGRKKLKESEKFYKVFVGDRDTGIVICELCRGGFYTRFIEGPEKTHATHLVFYIKRTLPEVRDKLPETIRAELHSAIENYEKGRYSTSFRNVCLVAEWLTERLFVKKFGKELAKETPRWENRLGKLLDQSRRNKRIPEETIIFQLFSLKWLRNRVDHPSEYKITGEDVRLGLISIMYILHQIYSYNLI
jgi:hypothetical protein